MLALPKLISSTRVDCLAGVLGFVQATSAATGLWASYHDDIIWHYHILHDAILGCSNVPKVDCYSSNKKKTQEGNGEPPSKRHQKTGLYSNMSLNSKSMGQSSFIELDDGKIYRKALYLMVKTMVSCKFSLKPIQWIIIHNISQADVRIAFLTWPGDHHCIILRAGIHFFHHFTHQKWDILQAILQKIVTHPIFSFRLGNDFLRDHESLRPTDCLWMLLHSFWAIDIVDPFPNTIPVRNQRCWTTGKSLVCRWSTFLSWCIYIYIYILYYIYIESYIHIRYMYI